MRWVERLLFGRRGREAAPSTPSRTLTREQAKELRDSQRETLLVLQKIGEEARNKEALEYARRRGQEIRRLEQEYDLYRLERGE